MENIIGTIANNLQNIRKERQMTLQDLADLTGVSKSMLREIERGTSSPTITMLWKISTGLKVPISQLIHEPSPKYAVVHKEDWDSMQEENYRIDMIFACDQNRDFEVYHMEFQPGAAHEHRIHDKGIVEYTMVYEGCMHIIVNGEPFCLNPGDSFIFEGEHEHTYRNEGDVLAKAYSIIHYR